MTTALLENKISYTDNTPSFLTRIYNYKIHLHRHNKINSLHFQNQSSSTIHMHLTDTI